MQNQRAHLNCMIKWDNLKASTSGSGSIAAELSQSHKASVEKNRKYLDVVRLLSKPSLTFRGHCEGEGSESRGNFIEICSFLSKYDSDFQTKQSNYFNATNPDL